MKTMSGFFFQADDLLGRITQENFAQHDDKAEMMNTSSPGCDGLE